MADAVGGISDQVDAFLAETPVSRMEGYGRHGRIREIGVTIGISMDMVSDQERSRAIGRAIETATLAAFDAAPAQVTSIFDECLSRLLGSSNSDWERVEISRRVYEAKVSILSGMSDAGDEFIEAWSGIERLGYSSLEREATMVFYFIRFIFKSGSDCEGKADAALSRLWGLICRMRALGMDDMALHFESVHSRLLQSRPSSSNETRSDSSE